MNARPPRLVLLTTLAERRIRRWIDARGRRHGVTAAGAGVLFHLAARPGSSVGEVTEALRASPAGASALLTRMESAGLIARSPDEHDRRTQHLDLTPAGREAQHRARTALAELTAQLTRGFSDEELEIVGRWLAHVAALESTADHDEDADHRS